MLSKKPPTRVRISPPPPPDDLVGWTAYLDEVDRALRSERLYLTESNDFVAFEKAVSSRMFASRFHYRYPKTRDLISTPEALADLYFRMGIDPWIRERVLCDRSTALSASRISDLFSASPRDILDSHLQSPLSDGFFGSDTDERLPNFKTVTVPKHFKIKPLGLRSRTTSAYDPKIAAVAFLITRDLVREDLVETYLPEIPFQEFQSLQSKIYREVMDTLPERLKRFSPYWDSVTTAEKKALRLIHMAPDGPLTYPEAAKELGISQDALKERLKNAVKKLKKVYPEYKAIRGVSRRVWKSKDLDRMGLLNLARAKVPLPVTRIDPVTGKRLETFDQPKATVRTPIAGLPELILKRKRSFYNPFYDGVGRPSFEPMRVMPEEVPGVPLRLLEIAPSYAERLRLSKKRHLGKKRRKPKSTPAASAILPVP